LVVAVDADALAEGEEAAAFAVLEEDVADPMDPDQCELSHR